MYRTFAFFIAIAFTAGTQAEAIAADSCTLSAPITEAAERKPGGALYKGPMATHHGEHAGHGKKKMQMPEMKGAHMDHDSRHGGAFFMAPDKMHHLEAVYSEHCGFQVFFFNAFTQPIRADRFRGFVMIAPEREDEPETIRFLSPSPDGAVLEIGKDTSVSRPFDANLYIKFPEADAPELFTVKIKGSSPAPKKPEGAVELRIKDRKLAGVKVVRVKEGEAVDLYWVTDETVELHLHGYDIEVKAKPGAPAAMSFKAHATGRFPVTAHGFGDHHGGGHSEKTLLYLEVHPN